MSKPTYPKKRNNDDDDKKMANEFKKMQTRLVVAERLKIARAVSGMKQKEVAEKAFINPTTYSGYENGVGVPPIEVMVQLADLYNVTIDYLAGRAPFTDEFLNNSYDDEDEIAFPTYFEIIERLEKLEKVVNNQDDQ